MAQKLYEESNIQAIADAIREKNGETTTYKTSEMAAAITAITTGGGGGDIEPIVLKGSQYYGCPGSLAGVYIENFGDTISTENITDSGYMFYQNTAKEIPFDINYSSSTNHTMDNMFYNCQKLERLPKINGAKPASRGNMFDSCGNLREIPEDYFDGFDWSYIDNLTSPYSGKTCSTFANCYSLRSFPMEFLKHGNQNVGYYNHLYYNLFYNCLVLDEVVNLPVWINSVLTTNAFGITFGDCNRLNRITFATQEDGSPYVVNWKNQTIDLTGQVGRVSGGNEWSILNYNSGITNDKRVYDDATYQALKNDPDWYAVDDVYSRYNHTSAVETINSLPDTSAYLATAGGTNTIKFKGASGELTDGGAINTLTPEEIAVATERGWTVTIN